MCARGAGACAITLLVTWALMRRWRQRAVLALRDEVLSYIGLGWRPPAIALIANSCANLRRMTSINREQKLETQVRLLCAALGIDCRDPESVIPSDLLELARDGQSIQAVRRLRRQEGLSLLAAKRVVDAAGT